MVRPHLCLNMALDFSCTRISAADCTQRRGTHVLERNFFPSRQPVYPPSHTHICVSFPCLCLFPFSYHRCPCLHQKLILQSFRVPSTPACPRVGHHFYSGLFILLYSLFLKFSSLAPIANSTLIISTLETKLL